MTATIHFSGTPSTRVTNGSCELGSRRTTRRRDRAAKQEALIQAALKLFASKGYEVTTTREIAAAAGCAEGLIHRYFRGKEGLLTALIEHNTSQEIVDLARELQPAPSLEEEFTQLVLWEVDRMWNSQDFLKIFMPRAFADPKFRAVMYRAVVSVRSGVILERLKRYSSSSIIRRDDLESLAQCVGMFGFVFGFVRPLVLGQKRMEARKLATSTARILIRGTQPITIDNQLF